MSVAQKLNEFFTGIRRQKSEEVETAEQIYQQLVLTVADQKTPSIDEVLPILSDAFRTPEDLERDVTRVLNRREWKRRIDQEPEIRAEREKLIEAIQAERERFTQSRKEHESRLQELSRQEAELHSRLNECANARASLLSTADPASTTAVVDHVAKEIDPIRIRLNVLEQELLSLTAFKMASVPKESEAFAAMKKQADALRKEQKELQAKLAEQHAKTDALQKAQLEP